jgi:hypothetical protein
MLESLLLDDIGVSVEDTPEGTVFVDTLVVEVAMPVVVVVIRGTVDVDCN